MPICEIKMPCRDLSGPQWAKFKKGPSLLSHQGILKTTRHINISHFINEWLQKFNRFCHCNELACIITLIIFLYVFQWRFSCAARQESFILFVRLISKVKNNNTLVSFNCVPVSVLYNYFFHGFRTL